jgi:murein DD-endopeptidase MepM/ murein hydrolase activator NlpD
MADQRPPGPYAGPESATGRLTLHVSRLFEEAGLASERYERDRRSARSERARARRLEKLLNRERRVIGRLREDVGRFARHQYRTGGSLPYTAQLLAAADPDELLRGYRVARLADLSLSRTLNAADRASRELAENERKAAAAWHELRARTRYLAKVRRGIEQKLAEAQSRLQQQADRAAARGRCPGPVRAAGGRDSLAGPRQGSSRWTRPAAEYELSAGYDSAGARWASRHTGQDLAVPIGTPVRSVGTGQVVAVECGGGFGISVLIRHPDGYYSQYAHLAALFVRRGEAVGPGQRIALSGDTGNSTGPHLHFEVRVTPRLGSAIDPVRWLRERGVRL